jgi:hypothetical protein
MTLRVKIVHAVQLAIVGIDWALHKVDDWLLRLSFRIGDLAK